MLATTAAAKDNKYMQTMAKIEQARAICEAKTAAVDNKAMDDDVKYSFLFPPNPNVLKIELKQATQTHNERLRECIYKQEAGRKQWQ